MRKEQLKRLARVLLALVISLFLVALAVAFYGASKKPETPKIRIVNVGGLV